MLLMISCTFLKAEAAPFYSWDLSRSMAYGITTNPFGAGNVWTLMYDSVGTSHNESNYRAMPSYSPAPASIYSRWLNPAQNYLLIGVADTSYNTPDRGTPIMHPAPMYSAVVAWKSPINGTIDIMGKFTDADASCGDGVSWFIDKGNTTLMTKTFSNGGETSFIQQNISVSIGTNLYFIVSSGSNNSNLCDTTALELLITQQHF